jgi:hypothetical protein
LENNFSLDESIRDDIPQVTEGENEKLTKPFCEEEVKKAIFDMKHNTWCYIVYYFISCSDP